MLNRLESKWVLVFEAEKDWETEQGLWSALGRSFSRHWWESSNDRSGKGGERKKKRKKEKENIKIF